MAMTTNSRPNTLAALAKTRELLEAPWGESEQSLKTLLKRRAAALARPRESAPNSGPALDLLLFRLARECYGIDLVSVEKVMNWKPYVSLPGAPAHLLGVADVNGEILAIVDPRVLFSLPGGPPPAAGHVIVLGQAEACFGLPVDGVEGVRSVARAEIQPPPVSLPPEHIRYLLGVTTDGLIVLNGDRLVSDAGWVTDRDSNPLHE